ncbi:hypothetical protein WN51_04238 [Melipona quadrifasciata]|uniref:Uncharacterized protein n=1 Tax=Melipona quadrifasciata TaxID=166423 RepID=A0A0N0BE87_9HYME|nr:hypothetical protein WN51_04238 [Melipona quadrifasciata]
MKNDGKVQVGRCKEELSADTNRIVIDITISARYTVCLASVSKNTAKDTMMKTVWVNLDKGNSTVLTIRYCGIIVGV